MTASTLSTPTGLVLGLALTIGLPGQALAQVARASLSANHVAVNQQFVLDVEVQGSRQLDQDPTLPDLSAFAVYLGSGTSTSIQIVNGRSSTSLTIQSRFRATQEGTFEIGPVRLRIGGQDVQTDPLTIQVTSKAASTARSGPAGADGVVAREDLFVTATASAQQVYVNEPVTVEYRIFTRVDIEGYNITQQPDTPGFWVEEIGDPQQGVEQVVRDGVQYASSVIRRIALFAASSGTKTLEPLTLEAQVRVQRAVARPVRRPVWQRRLGGGLFGGLAPVVVGSDPVEIEVLPLPAGQPASYTGLVGQLEVSATIDRTAGRDKRRADVSTGGHRDGEHPDAARAGAWVPI